MFGSQAHKARRRDSLPPATNTLPSESDVAVCAARAVVMLKPVTGGGGWLPPPLPEIVTIVLVGALPPPHEDKNSTARKSTARVFAAIPLKTRRKGRTRHLATCRLRLTSRIQY